MSNAEQDDTLCVNTENHVAPFAVTSNDLPGPFPSGHQTIFHNLPITHAVHASKETESHQ